MKEIKDYSPFPFSDSFIFNAVMSKSEITKAFLESLLGLEISEIQYIKNDVDSFDDEPQGISMDVYTGGKNKTLYNVEIQMVDSDDDVERRMRWCQSKIDIRFLERGEMFENFPQSYVIFVCDFDCYERGLAQYSKTNVFKDADDVTFDDGCHSIILNSHYEVGNAPKEILEFLDFIRAKDDDFPCKSALVQRISDEFRAVKDSAKTTNS